MEGYSVKIVRTSRELTAKEKIQLKDLSDALSLDAEVTYNGSIVMHPQMFAELAVHNENAKQGNNKDYANYVVVDENGTKYATGSQSFWSAFQNIMDEITEEAEDGFIEDYAIKIFAKESKNFTGKHFLTCSII